MEHRVDQVKRWRCSYNRPPTHEPRTTLAYHPRLDPLNRQTVVNCFLYESEQLFLVESRKCDAHVPGIFAIQPQIVPPTPKGSS
eukprot:scaffold23647_cov51-Attheya_sp.AAC.1